MNAALLVDETVISSSCIYMLTFMMKFVTETVSYCFLIIRELHHHSYSGLNRSHSKLINAMHGDRTIEQLYKYYSICKFDSFS